MPHTGSTLFCEFSTMLFSLFSSRPTPTTASVAGVRASSGSARGLDPRSRLALATTVSTVDVTVMPMDSTAAASAARDTLSPGVRRRPVAGGIGDRVLGVAPTATELRGVLVQVVQEPEGDQSKDVENGRVVEAEVDRGDITRVGTRDEPQGSEDTFGDQTGHAHHRPEHQR